MLKAAGFREAGMNARLFRRASRRENELDPFFRPGEPSGIVFPGPRLEWSTARVEEDGIEGFLRPLLCQRR